jgi:hypothetical protein
MTWNDISDADGESADVFQPSATPFSQQRRKRLVVLALLVGGGLLAIVGMRVVSGGPTAANADTAAEVAISRYLAPPAEDAEPSAGEDPLAVLAGFGAPPASIPVDSLRSNPFVLPGSNADTPLNLAPANLDHARSARMTEMQMTVEAMRVSMVLEGRHSVAIVGGTRLPMHKPVEYDADLILELSDVNARGLVVTATDPELGATIDVRLSRP